LDTPILATEISQIQSGCRTSKAMPRTPEGLAAALGGVVHEGAMIVPDTEARPTQAERKKFLEALGFTIK